MKYKGGIIMCTLAALMFVGIAGASVAVPELSNSGGGTWKYQREISIKENSGTALTDYQVLVELKGSDFPGEAQNNGADVRFTDFNNNELSYWIESWDYSGKSTKIWVKVPSISASTTAIIRMFYGNPSANSASNGDATFEFFDDFSGDLSKWTILDGATAVIDNGKVSITDTPNTDAFIHSKTFQTKNGIIEAKINVISTAGVAHWIIDGRWTSTDSHISYISVAARKGGGYNDFYIFDSPSLKGEVSWNANTLNTWYLFQLKMNEDNLEGNVYDMAGTLLESTQGTSTKGIGYVAIRSWGSSHTYYEDFRVRKYASLEPTVTLAPPKSSTLSITKSASPYSIRQFQETTINVSIENSGTTDIKATEVMDSIHPSFDLISGDFPNPKKYDIIHAGESREIQYTIKAKESGTFTLDPVTVTYADKDGNIQEVKSEPVSIKVVPSSDSSSAGAPSGQPSKSASVNLYGEKTDVVLGEDILLKLSAVNLITKPRMHVQVIIIPPSGMSVTSSEFSKSGAGQFTTSYELEPGDGKDIEVSIRSNQVGDFNVNGRIIYYFGEEKDKGEDYTLNLPIKVRKEPGQTALAGSNYAGATPKAPGFAGEIAIIGVLFVALLIKRKCI